MMTEPKTVTITIDPDSEIGRAVAQIRGNFPIVCVEINGECYRLTPENPLAHYDREGMRAFLDERTGPSGTVDVEAIIQDYREQRG